jgi:uncharacterized protein YcbX
MRLASIHTYPVKGCRRTDHAAASVEPWGLAGDRRWLLTDDDGQMLTQREEPRLTRLRPVAVEGGGLVLRADGRPALRVVAEPGEPTEVRVHRDPVLATPAGGDAAVAWLSEVLDRKVRLLHLAAPTRRPVDPGYGLPHDRVSFADAYPLLLASTSALAALNDWIVETGEEPLPMNRFRPNVVVEGAPAWAEDGWVGRRVRIGAVTFRAPKLCDRCVVTTTDQDTGERGHEPLRTLARYRRWDERVWFGLNLIPDGTGEVRVGDEVTVTD